MIDFIIMIFAKASILHFFFSWAINLHVVGWFWMVCWPGEHLSILSSVLAIFFRSLISLSSSFSFSTSSSFVSSSSSSSSSSTSNYFSSSFSSTTFQTPNTTSPLLLFSPLPPSRDSPPSASAPSPPSPSPPHPYYFQTKINIFLTYIEE